MFNAFKKLASRQDAQSTSTNMAALAGANGQSATPNASCVPMSGSLQRRFAKGVQYNMKIIIKGDRSVGKSCLLERLQGRGFIENYTPSEEINVASIQWSFKATEDVVKVEVWDVVDRGKARARPTGLKLTTATPISETPALDAEFLDVYKGTHGVIMMMDITKNWTLEYVSKELTKIPSDIPVLLLGNHCDMAHHRVITQAQAIGLIEGLKPRTADILYGESSMRNGFGLRLLHKFLSLPFLQLQRETLTALLARNKRDSEVCSLELVEYLSSPEADYNRFLENLMNKRRQIADSNPKHLTHFSGNSTNSSAGAVGAPTLAGNYNRSVGNANQLNPELRATKSIIIGAGQPIVVPGQQINATIETQANAQKLKTNAEIGSATVLSKVNNETIASVRSNLMCEKANHDGGKVTVEEFCPDGGALDKGFLDDLPAISNSEMRQVDYNCDSDSDSNDTGNPLVAKFHEDPFDDFSINVETDTNKPIAQKSEPKVNPLAKSKNKIQHAPDLSVILTWNRRSSNSSDDIEIPNILNAKINENHSSDGQSNEEFDGWLSDSNQRRSPEGGEDETCLPSIDKTPNDAAKNISTEMIKSDRIQSSDVEAECETKEKSSKSKKKKKEKKEKKDKKEKEKNSKEMRRSKSKKSKNEGLLSENKEQFSHSKRQEVEEDQYEAL